MSELVSPAPIEVAEGTPGDDFDALYRERAGPVLLMFVRLTGSRADSEDLTQEVFVRAWGAWSSFRAESKAGTWLHSIALRVFVDWTRTPIQRIRRLSDALDRVPDIAAGALVPLADVDLERAIARLPPKIREAVVLHYLEGFPLAELARHLGRSSGTLKAQLHAGRSKLRKELDT